MTASVYRKTATKASNGTIYAFGRCDDLHGKPTSEGGYYVFKLCSNYDGQVRGGLCKTWRYVAADLGYADAVALMNKRCGHVAFANAD
jgi:hypothetical protein